MHRRHVVAETILEAVDAVALKVPADG